MADIRHRVGIAVPKEQVHEALATTEGLSAWWTRKVEGDSTDGGTLQFYFGRPEPGAVMEVEASRDDHIGWHCVAGVEEWVGTRVEFDLKSGEGETILSFAHADWREPSELMAHCATKWGYFLLGLKASLEGGECTAYPGDQKISSWG